MTLQEYNDLYKQPLLKQMTIVSSGGITIKNANIVSEQMSLEKSLCSETNLRYGRCEAACFKVRIADINHDFTGEWLEVTQEVVTDGEGYLLLQNGQYLLTEDGYKIKLKNEQIDEASATYGRFKVYSDKPSNDRRWRDLTCYDAMYDILNTDVLTWFNSLTFPMTIKNLRDSLFTHLGITQVTKTLINDNFSTLGGFSVSGSLSAKQVIEAICELNGVFGQITSDGKFDYISLDNPPTLTLDYYVDGTGSYEDYLTDAVTGINAKGTSNDVGVTVGTATNLYIISGNPLIYGTEGTSALTTALNTLLQHIISIQYRPYGVTTYGNPMLPLGTKITINTKNQTIVSYVVKKTLSGIQSLKDTISATGDKHQPTAVNSPTAEIFRTQGKVHELEIDVDGLTSRVSTTETNLANNYSTTQQMNSAIQQSATDITTQVSNTYVTQSTYNAEVQNLQDQIDGRIEYWDGNVVPTLNNAPASSWTTTSAKDSHIGDLYRYHHGTPEVTDYYRFDKDSSTTPATYSWVALGESQVDEALRQAELANQKADAAQLQLDALQQSVEDDYYTKSETNSQISQSASAITQSVSSTYETKSNATSHYNSLDSAAQGYANGALSTANTNAQGYANDAKNAAIADTNTKLQSYYTKSQTDSQISQTATNITQSVSSTYETKSDASSKLNTANTNAQGYANAAKNAAIADTDTKLQSYYTKSQTESKIDQKADAITSSVAATYTTKQDFNNLTIGGKNMLYFSEVSSDNLSNVKGGDNNITYTTADGYKCYRISGSQYVRLWSLIDHTGGTVNEKLKANTTYTYSVWAKVTGHDYNVNFNSLGHFQVYNSNSTKSDKSHEDVIAKRIYSPSTITKYTWTKIALTFTTNDLDGSWFGLYPSLGLQSGDDLYLRDFQLEEGNKATDWSPAPEDYTNYTDTRLTSYYTKTETESKIDQTATSITQTVSQTYTTKAEFGDLQIGGRNLLLNTAVSSDNITKCRMSNATVVTDGNRQVYRITGNNTAHIFNNTGTFDCMSEKLKADTTYTYSAWIKVNGTGEANYNFNSFGHFNVSNANSSASDKTHEDVAAKRVYSPSTFNKGEWVKISMTFTTNSLDGSSFGVYPIYNNGANTIVYMYGFKLEEGTRATDWSPAPEDLENYADVVGTSTLTAANAATDQKLTSYSTKSEVTQLANKIVMKVDDNGNIVQVALSADPSTGTAFTVSANNIDFIADGNIQLTSGTIGIYSTNFQVTSDGTVTAKAGQIGGWKITSTQFYDAVADEAGTTQGAGICKYGQGYAFWAGTSFANRNNAPLLIGHNGTLRASNAIISGKVTSSDLTVTGGSINLGSGVFKVENNGAVTCSNLTATGGSIGGLSVSTNGVYYQRTSSSYCGFTSTEWPLFINATSKTNPKTGAFRVNGIGSTVARDITLTNDSGSVAEISNSSKVWINSSATTGSLLTMYDLSGSMFLYAASGSSTPRLSISGNFSASGTKSRVVDTPDYGERLLYCYETPTPMFGDIGEGKIAEDGKCYVWLDSTFSETIKTESYQVFLQKYGQGECYVTERTSRYFVVEGDAGMCFGWELKARQAGYENDRLESFIEEEEPMESYDYPTEAIRHLEAIQNEREVA